MKFWRPLGRPYFRKIFDFGGQHGGKLAPKSKPKSMLSSKGVFSKNLVFPKEKHTFWRSSGSKLGGKIDEKSMWKSMRKQKGLKTQFWSIFDRFGSQHGSKLAPKIRQNRLKIDAKMVSDVDVIFWSVFDRFLVPTSTPEIWKIEPPLQREHDFWKISFPS